MKAPRCRFCKRSAPEGGLVGSSDSLWSCRFDEECIQHEYNLKMITRALTAQAWAVACAIFKVPSGSLDPAGLVDQAWYVVDDVASLPAPADLAARLMEGM